MFGKELSDSKNARHVEKYLKTYGFDTKMTPAMRKYLLDMPSAGSEAMISSSVASRFNNIINDYGSVMSGGRVVFPSEYFGASPNASYVQAPTFTQTSESLPPSVARMGLSHAGGLKVRGGPHTHSGLLKYNQFGGLASMYEKKFMRKLSLKPKDKKYVMDRLNSDITGSIQRALMSGGQLTKSGFEKKLKGL